MKGKEMVAMILAGGQGSRLGVLTKKLAKPAVPFGGKYRIIDFPLSNCSNSGCYTVGVLTQYKPLELNEHIGIGSTWDLDRRDGGVTILPPYQEELGGEWYKGTANAIYQNIEFIDRYNPEYVLILSGDHIYKMDYEKMLTYHKEKKAEATIAVIEVPIEEASRFGIMNTDDNNVIYEFEEKPTNPKSTKASMGIYIFNWKLLKSVLENDEEDSESKHDFGKNIIPNLIEKGNKVLAYPFNGYWKDVGTVESLWQANMDLLNEDYGLTLFDDQWKIYSVNSFKPAQYIGKAAEVKNSLIVEGCIINGAVENSVIFEGVSIGKGSKIRNSVIMPDSKIGDNVIIDKAIIGVESIIENSAQIGNGTEIEVIEAEKRIKEGTLLNICEEVC